MNRSGYMVAIAAIVTVTLVFAAMFVTLVAEIRANRQAVKTTQCILLVEPDNRTPKTVRACEVKP